MEDPKKTWNPQGKKKPILKIGGGGGGIGAVFLLGGALATAAFVSVFVFGKKGRSDRRKPELKSDAREENGEKEEQRLIVVDEASIVYEHRSGEEIKPGDDSAPINCLKEDVKQSDDEGIEENSVPEKLRSESVNEMPEALNEVCCNEKESELNPVDDFFEGIVNVGELEGISVGKNEEMNEDKCEKLIDDDIGNELINDRSCVTEIETTVDDYVHEIPLPVIDTPVVEIETVNGDAKECGETMQENVNVQQTSLPVIDDTLVVENGGAKEVVPCSETIQKDEVVEELVGEHQISDELVGGTDEPNLEQENDSVDAATEEFIESPEAKDDKSESSLQPTISQPTDVEDNLQAMVTEKVIDSSPDTLAMETTEEESKPDAVWSEKRDLIDWEVEGKTTEDAPVKVKGHEKQIGDNLAYCNQYCGQKETFVMKHVVEMAKANATNPVRRAVAIGTISTLSCSWFFGLSFVKLCGIVLLSMVLSKIHGY